MRFRCQGFAFQDFYVRQQPFHLRPLQYAPYKRTKTLLANNTQYCWLLRVGSVRTALLHVVECCWELLPKV